jgi:hypothetical protein
MNRVLEFQEVPEPEEIPYGDLYYIETPFSSFTVSREVARYIERRLNEPQRPRWLIFRTRTGARVRLRAVDIRSMEESTERSRQRGRRLRRALRREEKANKTWDDEER